MPKYVALLRGINVGGNILKMDRLRAICESLGFANVQTYLQSGNVVFDSKLPAAKIAASLQKKLTGQTRLAVSVLVRSAEDFRNIAKANPFLKEKGIDPAKLHVTFLAGDAPSGCEKIIGAISAGKDRFQLASREIYLHCPVSYGETKLSNNALQRATGLNATTRNWKTVNALLAMAGSGS